MPYLRAVGRARRQRYISQCEVLRISGLVFLRARMLYGRHLSRGNKFCADTSRSPIVSSTTDCWTRHETSVRFHSDSYSRSICIGLRRRKIVFLQRKYIGITKSIRLAKKNYVFSFILLLKKYTIYINLYIYKHFFIVTSNFIVFIVIAISDRMFIVAIITHSDFFIKKIFYLKAFWSKLAEQSRQRIGSGKLECGAKAQLKI